jgi:ribosome modulation factor
MSRLFNQEKPECYTDADWQMVCGYMQGFAGKSAELETAAYKHGYKNGVSDRTGVPHETVEVLRRRAAMIPGITL